MTGLPVYQWQPGTAEIAARAGIAPDEVIRFDHNTSPQAPPWVAEEAAAATRRASEYPAADYRPLKDAAAAYAGVGSEQVMVGAGADELILIAAKAWLGPGRVAAADLPAYSLYRIAAAQQDAEFRTVDRPAPHFPLPTAAVAERAAASDLLYLCQPHNPTGQRAPDDEIEQVVAAAGGIVVLDAAYAEFTGDRWAPWLERHPNLVVLHTLSKAFGLASIRVGYSLASAELTRRLEALRPPGSISAVSAALAIRALGEPEVAKSNVAMIVEERSRLAQRFTALGFRVIPSDTNFLLCEVGPHAPDLERALMNEGLVVRSYAAGALTEYLRFTVRTAAQHDRLIDAIERNLP